MRLLVCGGRDYGYTERVFDNLREYNPSVVIQGGARGADALARDWCRINGMPCITMDAQWDYHGKKAGVLRNQWMLDYCKPDAVLAFPGGKGTANMVKLAKQAGIHVTEIPDD